MNKHIHTSVFQGSVFIIVPGSEILLGRFNSRDEYMELLDDAQKYDNACGVSVHGVVDNHEISGEMSILTARILA